MPQLIAMIVEKLLLKFGVKTQSSIITGCFKISNSGGFQTYSGEKPEMAPGDEEMYRAELQDRYGGEGRMINGVGNGSGIIKVLIIIVLEIIIFGAFAFPMFGKAEGMNLVVMLTPVIFIMIAVPVVMISLSSNNKDKLELSRAINSGTIEIFDYTVTDKFESSGKSGKSSCFIFIGEVSISVDLYLYNTLNKGDKVRCAVIDDLGAARYLAVLDKAPGSAGGTNAEPTMDDIFNRLVGRSTSSNKKR